MTAPTTAAALVIGTELLTGKVVEGNLQLLARTLRDLGILLDRAVVIPDEHRVIVEEVRALSASRDVVFTSGGMGPTHDDVTVQAVAAAFDVSVVIPERTRTLLDQHFGSAVSDGHLRMARVPEGARLVQGKHGPWPTAVMKNVWLLPGVPQLFARTMSLIRSELGGGRPFVSLWVATNLDECTIKPLLDQVVADWAEVEVGSYPKWRSDGYRTEVTFDGVDEAAVRAARDRFVGSLPEGSLLPDPD